MKKIYMITRKFLVNKEKKVQNELAYIAIVYSIIISMVVFATQVLGIGK